MENKQPLRKKRGGSPRQLSCHCLLERGQLEPTHSIDACVSQTQRYESFSKLIQSKQSDGRNHINANINI